MGKCRVILVDWERLTIKVMSEQCKPCKYQREERSGQRVLDVSPKEQRGQHRGSRMEGQKKYEKMRPEMYQESHFRECFSLVIVITHEQSRKRDGNMF